MWTTLNFKTNNTHNYQKIELYGSATTKDLKKPQSSRWIGGVEMWRQGGEAGRLHVAQRGGSSSGTGKVVPYVRVADKNWEGYLGSKRSQPKDRLHIPGFQCQEDKFP